MFENENVVVASAILTVVIIVGVQFLARRKSDLFWYTLPAATFLVPQNPPAQFRLTSQTIAFRNVGREVLEDCEIVMSRRVREFEIRVEPARAVADIALPEGAHSYRLGTLGKQEVLFVSFLFGEPLAILQVRHKGGRVFEGALQHQRRVPNPLLLFVGFVTFAGIFFLSVLVLDFVNRLSPLAFKTFSDWLLSSPPKAGS